MKKGMRTKKTGPSSLINSGEINILNRKPNHMQHPGPNGRLLNGLNQVLSIKFDLDLDISDHCDLVPVSCICAV